MSEINKLEDVILENRNSLKTDRLDMSYGEILNLYENDELIISPQFQRLFRWSIYQRTRFLESILLGIPTPPIFVAEDSDGNWELVDGLQRISTIISFFGKLRDRDKDNNWVMEQGGLIKELEGFSLSTLPETYVKNIKRTYCRVEIIKWDSEYDLRYELFNRLNTGGTPLKEQEIRNCIFRGTSEKFNDLLLELSKNTDFASLISLSEQKKSELYDQELVLRFLALYNSDLDKIETKNISEFMTNYMQEEVKNRDFDYEANKDIFNRVMKVLVNTNIKFKFKNNQFSTSLYDAITVAVAKNIEKYEIMGAQDIEAKVEELKKDDIFNKYVGSASSSKTRVLKRMKRAMELFGDV
ncbi:DUF262 domain-containing protein [Clostridium perfringens]|uniref:DUF262 domain-containing protein n=1 Tax=Clostridium perfringens TaxID=1502 RepID=UPI00399CB99B